MADAAEPANGNSAKSSITRKAENDKWGGDSIETSPFAPPRLTVSSVRIKVCPDVHNIIKMRIYG
jgi:hypothetical protein